MKASLYLKKNVFVLGVAHGDPSFAQVSWLGKKIVIFRGF